MSVTVSHYYDCAQRRRISIMALPPAVRQRLEHEITMAATTTGHLNTVQILIPGDGQAAQRAQGDVPFKICSLRDYAFTVQVSQFGTNIRRRYKSAHSVIAGQGGV